MKPVSYFVWLWVSPVSWYLYASRVPYFMNTLHVVAVKKFGMTVGITKIAARVVCERTLTFKTSGDPLIN